MCLIDANHVLDEGLGALRQRVTASQKKLRTGQLGLSRRRSKRPCNEPLSTGRCYYQASEEESLGNLLAAAGVEAEPPAYGEER
jgi:hypothetical protein